VKVSDVSVLGVKSKYRAFYAEQQVPSSTVAGRGRGRKETGCVLTTILGEGMAKQRDKT
jgi:hypothetical protein